MSNTSRNNKERNKYGECRKYHQGGVDGCQEFEESWLDPSICGICGCHRNFHRRVVPPVKYETKVVYTKCHKIHDFKFQSAVDGCQEFTPSPGTAEAAINCAVCGCHKVFHRNEITVEVT